VIAAPRDVIDVPASTSRIGRAAATAMRAAIRLAGGREVCFVCGVDDDGVIVKARVVARGDVRSVLALPGCAQRGEMLVHNHPTGLLDPSDADLHVATNMHDGGIGFGIINNDASELYVVVEVPREAAHAPLDPAKIDADLGARGAIARKLARYEDRESQRAMARAVTRLYNEGGVGLLEAGTGVGKSLGYLVPALRWAAANGERTVVSTNTINLQEQLVGKDLPFLESALSDQKVRFALLKGWRNYLCLFRLAQTKMSGGALFEDGMKSELADIEAWSEKTSDGSLSDLTTQPRSEVWDEVAAEPDLCQRMKCAYFDKCFLFAARRKAAQADVIVVNHHLLMSDVAVRRSSQNWDDAAVLPAYDRLVVDEGHHLEDAAAAHLGATTTRRALQRLFNRLDRKGKGLLNALEVRLYQSDDLYSVASLDLVHSRLAPSLQAARDKASMLFDILETFLQLRNQPVVRLTADFSTDPIWAGGLDASLEDLLAEIEILADGLRLVRERMEADSKRAEVVAPLLNEMRGVARRLQAAADSLRNSLKPGDKADPSVRWIEVRGKERNLAVTAVPLDLAPILREDLFKRVKTAVITSATLAAQPKASSSRTIADESAQFDFLARRLGLDDPELLPSTAIFPSPFAYETQSLLAIPTDVPAPNADAQGHFQAVVRAVIDLATASDGGLFVLYTSHKDVRATAAELRARGSDRRWPLLVHGEDSRDALLRRFRDSERAILLGTASFWEGVDVPGRALRGLVIAKLPFRVPTEPITAAHCEAIEAHGGDSFTDYMLPHASLRLKQGFGRLIRTATDRGVVVMCDPRIVTKTYGKGLLRALPPARRLLRPWAEIAVEIARFYEHAADVRDAR
jgi:ATP-dependent DNA helicase DinG